MAGVSQARKLADRFGPFNIPHEYRPANGRRTALRDGYSDMIQDLQDEMIAAARRVADSAA